MREAPLAISDICFTLLITPILHTDLREENNIKECIRLGNKQQSIRKTFMISMNSGSSRSRLVNINFKKKLICLKVRWVRIILTTDSSLVTLVFLQTSSWSDPKKIIWIGQLAPACSLPDWPAQLFRWLKGTMKHVYFLWWPCNLIFLFLHEK